MEYHGTNEVEAKIPDWLIAKWVTDMACCSERGTEEGHIYADDLLCDILTTLGLSNVVEEFSKLDKWYS